MHACKTRLLFYSHHFCGSCLVVCAQQTTAGGVKPAAPPRVRKENPSEQRQSWTNEEDHIISTSVLEFGHRWNRIAERLPRRTEHAIRNRWHRLQMRAVEGLEGLTDGLPVAQSKLQEPPKPKAAAAAVVPTATATAVSTVPPGVVLQPTVAIAKVSPHLPQVSSTTSTATLVGAPSAEPPSGGVSGEHHPFDEELGELPTGFDFDSMMSM